MNQKEAEKIADVLSASDQNPGLFDFILAMAELLPEPDKWQKFIIAFRKYDESSRPGRLNIK